MAMSKDRVEFKLPHNRIQELRELLKECFNITSSEYSQMCGRFSGCCQSENDVTIVCRPSQFARFLIKRNDMGLTNGFKELKPKLIVAQPMEQRIEVWNRHSC